MPEVGSLYVYTRNFFHGRRSSVILVLEVIPTEFSSHGEGYFELEAVCDGRPIRFYPVTNSTWNEMCEKVGDHVDT